MITTTESYLQKIKNGLVFDSKGKQPVTQRTADLRDTLLKIIPHICSERAFLLTESMKETEGQPMILRRARGLKKILDEMTVFIRPGELIVGNQATQPRAAPVFPEFAIQYLIDELDGKPMRPEERPGDRFIVTEKDETTLREIAAWWRGKTVQDYKMNLVPDDVYQASFKQVVFLMNQGDSGGNGHFIADYAKVLNKGLTGIIKEAEEELKNLRLWETEDFEKKYFLEAVIITLKATIDFAKRFSILARELAEKEADPARKAELERIAQHCEWVPANPARTFWEAMQSLWFAHLIIQIESNGHSVSFGRFDQYMYPFYEQDMAAGRITTEEIVELIECLWIKSLELNKVRSWYHTRFNGGYPMFQNLTLGGQTTDGRSAINDLSWLPLEATANLKIPSPSVSVRYWNGMPEDFLMKCLQVIGIHRGGQPALYNDEAIITSQLLEGVKLEDAYDYGIVGCVEPSEPGKGLRPGNLFHHYSLLKVMEITLNNGKDPRTGITLHPNQNGKDLCTFDSFEELVAALKDQIRYYTRLMVTASNCVGKAWAELTPTPFASGLMDDCIKKGKDLEWGGGRYNSAGMLQIGMSHVGNSLAALKKVIFEEKRLTPEQVKHALETDFEDNMTTPTGAEIRQILLQVPKYGNDEDYTDLLVKDIYEFAAKEITNYKVYTTGATGNTQTSPVSGHVALGGFCGATPDGRKAGMPMNEGLSPAQGTDIKGPTATLKSVTKLNHALCSGGTLLNQKFDPIAFKDTGQLRRLASLVRTYFSLKGMHIQFNVVSTETLRDAQRHPEKYANLLIRVAGYSALFTTLEPAIQDDIIARTEQSWS